MPKIESLRAVDSYNGGLEAHNVAVEGMYTSGRRFASLGEKQDPDPH
jgi:hypothetical protein